MTKCRAKWLQFFPAAMAEKWQVKIHRDHFLPAMFLPGVGSGYARLGIRDSFGIRHFEFGMGASRLLPQ